MPKLPITEGVPIGNNGLGAVDMWLERDMYTEVAKAEAREPTIDLYYGEHNGEKIVPGKLLYGRVDLAGFAVYPAEENLKQIFSRDGKTYFALNFVADAFHDFQRYWRAQVDRNPFMRRDPGPLRKMDCKKSWLSTHKSFHEVWKGRYMHFTNPKRFMSTRRDEQIVNFEGFLRVFREYAKIITPRQSLTRSQYITSRWASPNFSGLTIEIIEGGKHGDDYAKFAGFLKDANYKFYEEVARRFGFVVDINAPWRLFADVSSPPMAEYMRKYGVKNLKQMFLAYYIPAYKFDVDIMRHYMRNMYNSYVAANPNVKVRQSSECRHGKSVWKLTKREVLTPEQFDRLYPPSWWLRFYTWCRATETDQPWDQRKFDKVVDVAKDYEKSLNMQAALVYINTECGGFKKDLHGYPTLSEQEIEEIKIQKGSRVGHATFNF